MAPEIEEEEWPSSDLCDGDGAVISLNLCKLNLEISKRTLSDIGFIMHVSKLISWKKSISWTDNSVTFYVYQMDWKKFEKYLIQKFEKEKRRRM